MTFIGQATSRQDLEVAIINDAGLYARFDEARLLNDDYSTEEMLEIVQAWIEAGDECAAA